LLDGATLITYIRAALSVILAVFGRRTLPSKVKRKPEAVYDPAS
jgi:hypothetical protein